MKHSSRNTDVSSRNTKSKKGRGHNSTSNKIFLKMFIATTTISTILKRQISVITTTPPATAFVSAFTIPFSTKATAIVASTPPHQQRFFASTTSSTTHLSSTKQEQEQGQDSSSQTNNPPSSPSQQQQQQKPALKKQQLSYTESVSGYKPPTVNWYPGHIAKAERLLSETLKSADVLIEVRDARIPRSTAHPRVREWTAGRPRIVVLTRVDMITKASMSAWKKTWEQTSDNNTSGSNGSSSSSINDAGRWDGQLQDGDILHHARQNMAQRGVTNPQKLEQGGGVEVALWVDAKHGQGIQALHRAILRAGKYVNERRLSRGLRERPLRVAILGYPNVGKSALINRIIGKKRARSANTPGITRSLQWIRIRGDGRGGTLTDEKGRARKGKKGVAGSEYELLDSPGIIPANMENQEDALLLACCNSIGNGAYDNQGIAAYLCERLKTLHVMGKGPLTSPQWRQKCVERYRFDPLDPVKVPSLSIDDEDEMRIPTGEDMLFMVADNTCRSDPENAARKILQDFRSGRMGPMALQLAPRVDDDEVEDGQERVDVKRSVSILGESFLYEGEALKGEDTEEAREERARTAMNLAKERGLELPPVVEETLENQGDEDSNDESNVGKGLFDGW